MHCFIRFPRRSGAALLTLSLVAALAGPVRAELLVLDSARDNTLIQVPSAGSQQMSNGRGPNLFVGRNNGDPGTFLRRGLLRFQVADAIPEGAQILSVSLTMQVTQGNNADVIQLRRLLRDWGEGASSASGGMGAPAEPPDATWYFNQFDTSRWSTPGGDFAAFASASTAIRTPGLYTWASTENLIADVQRWLDDPDSNFGWLLMGGETQAGNVHGFATREAGGALTPPRLTIEYQAPAPAVPEPGSFLLLAAGGACAAFMRIRRAWVQASALDS